MHMKKKKIKPLIELIEDCVKEMNTSFKSKGLKIEAYSLGYTVNFRPTKE